MFQAKKRFLFLAVAVLLLIQATSSVIPALASVTLTSFTAIPGQGQVLVVWETATEVDNAGFTVFRSTHQNSGFEAISDFIPAMGGGSSSREYSFSDTRVTNGTVYFYELIAISNRNESQTFPPVGPIVPGVTAATATGNSAATRTATGTVSTNGQTSTPTRTPTQARTPTSTQNGAYPGPVQTPYPGPIETPNPTQNLTPYPGPVTSVPTGPAQTPGTNATSANNSTQLDGPTSTLRPFPSVTYEFPDATQTPVILKQSTPEPGDSNRLSGWVNVTRLGPLALILLIWVLLGGWFYLTLRRME
jgi:hypothetical protein